MLFDKFNERIWVYAFKHDFTTHKQDHLLSYIFEIHVLSPLPMDCSLLFKMLYFSRNFQTTLSDFKTILFPSIKKCVAIS